MRIIKRVFVIVLLLILKLLRNIINLLIKAECWVAGVGSLLLAIFGIVAVVNRMWLQLGVFGILFVSLISALFLSMEILILIDNGINKFN